MHILNSFTEYFYSVVKFFTLIQSIFSYTRLCFVYFIRMFNSYTLYFFLCFSIVFNYLYKLKFARKLTYMRENNISPLFTTCCFFCMTNEGYRIFLANNSRFLTIILFYMERYVFESVFKGT